MKKKICFVVAVPITVQAFLQDHIKALSQEYDVYLMGNIRNKEEVGMDCLAGCHQIDIQRSISLWHDLKAVWQAYRYFRKMRFDAIHSVTPKAGLVAALAAWCARIKHRTHIFTGQVWATKKGIMRNVLKMMDRMIATLNNHVMVDGMSQRTFLEQEGVVKEGKAMVFCNGSIAGVNAERFAPDEDARQMERRKMGISERTLVYIFLGRLNHDKGIDELYRAFDKLASEAKDVFLLLVGFDEEKYIERLSDYKNIKDGKNFHYYGIAQTPEKILNAGDVFVLPTYREGFGSSVLEAACIGLPCICSDAYGVLDAYIENQTGLRCKVGDAESLYQCMKTMHDDRGLVLRMGKASRQRALRDFDVKPITTEWVTFYRSILKD